MADYILREDAIEAHCMRCQNIDQEDDKNACWCMEKDRINRIPAADVVEVVRCKNCKHRPVVVNPSRPYGFGLAGPGSDPFCRDETCPYLCDDGYYNRMPDDDGFCNFGEAKDG